MTCDVFIGVGGWCYLLKVLSRYWFNSKCDTYHTWQILAKRDICHIWQILAKRDTYYPWQILTKRDTYNTWQILLSVPKRDTCHFWLSVTLVTYGKSWLSFEKSGQVWTTLDNSRQL